MGIFDNEKAERELASKEHYFYVERKITTWVRERHCIEAESKEDAIKLMFDTFKLNELECTDTYIEQEHLYNTDTPMSIEGNEGNATCELYYGSNQEEFIIDNLGKTTI
jgi:hypothetical protein